MIAELTQDTSALFNQVSEWVRQHNWTVESEVEYVDLPNSHDVMENHGIRVVTPEGRIHLDAAGTSANGKVIVNMFAWPTLVRIRLLHTPGSGPWIPVTDVGMELRYDWDEAGFVRLAQDMLAV